MFAVDDPMSQFLADYYGVVMGTSHQEPMMRSTPLEFNKFAQGPYDFATNAANITVRAEHEHVRLSTVSSWLSVAILG